MDTVKVRPLGFGAFGVGFARLMMRLLGWHIRGERPQVDKCVFVCAPHIKNQDLFMMLFTALILRLPVYFLMKDEAFVGPLGWIWRQMGGIPVNRRERKDLVGAIANAFKQHDQMYLVIAPEGTRKNTEHWRTGYYWMAHEAGVPVVCSHCCYDKKQTGVGGMHYTTGDVEADFAHVRAYYAEVMPDYKPDIPPQDKDKQAASA